MRTIVVSAVNLRKGGTLSILKGCLQYLSGLAMYGDFRIVALVHRKELAYYPYIHYIEMPWTVKTWVHRLWCEYVTMHKISEKLSPVHLWLSLHDTTPRVVAHRRAVYCQTSFPFLQWEWKDLQFNYKIPLFALFTRYAYRINVHRNDFLIVQQNWLREEFSKMLGVSKAKIIVSPPECKSFEIAGTEKEETGCYTFLYPASPDCHKNFEVLCKAAALLEKEMGKDKFQVIITISGNENKYARWLYKKWGKLSSVRFAGFMDRVNLERIYIAADCLVFPSRIETWGLPISEFMTYDKPMLLADLPYAHETAAGSCFADFFPVDSSVALKERMKRLIGKNGCFLSKTSRQVVENPVAFGWKGLFGLLLEQKFLIDSVK